MADNGLDPQDGMWSYRGHGVSSINCITHIHVLGIMSILGCDFDGRDELETCT